MAKNEKSVLDDRREKARRGFDGPPVDVTLPTRREDDADATLAADAEWDGDFLRVRLCQEHLPAEAIDRLCAKLGTRLFDFNSPDYFGSPTEAMPRRCRPMSETTIKGETQ